MNFHPYSLRWLEWWALRCLLILFACWVPGVSLGIASVDGVSVEAGDDGRTFSISAPGVRIQDAQVAVQLENDQGMPVFSSAQGRVHESHSMTRQVTPHGLADVLATTIRFDEFDLLLRVERLEAAPVVLLNAGIHNRGARPLKVPYLYPLVARSEDAHSSGAKFILEGGVGDWILTGFAGKLESIARQFDAALATQDWMTLVEHFALYHKQGGGFFMGPVGYPVAWVDSCFLNRGGTPGGIQVRSDMQISLSPGETRWGQHTALFFEPASLAMPRWVDWVAKTHQARSSLGALCGWIGMQGPDSISGKAVLGILDAVKASDGRLRPEGILIDRVYGPVLDGKLVGNPELETNAQFSEGLEFYAREIEGIRARPGLWLGLDMSPDRREEFLQALRKVVGMGFGLLKVPLTISPQRIDGHLTSFQRERQDWNQIRAAVGDSTYLLSNSPIRTRAGIGFFDASRVGLNANRGSGVRSSIESCLWALPMNGRFFAVDFDRCFLATEVKDIDPLVGGWPMARTWLSMVGLSCGNAFTSDRWDLPKFSPYLRNFQILTPPASEVTSVLDLGVSDEWPRLVGHVVRPWGKSVVALLWNPGTTERRVDLDLERVGGRPGAHYAVWSFWQNSYLGIVEHQYTSTFLAPGASEHLVFTEIPENATRPLLIGSNFHIYCGAAEIKQFSALESGMEIEFTDAGAPSGSLFVYSKTQPLLSVASGCVVSGIVSAGENVWRIDIQERQFGEPQRVVFILPKPPYRHAWFWGLVGVLLCSVAFGGYKVVSLARARKAIENIQAREEERSRIARDLHDELGSSLAHIAMLGSRITGDQSPKDPSVLNKILESSKESLQRLDEIVWSVNPARDSTEHLASYLHKFTAGYLADSGIRLRTEIPEILPEYPLTSKERRALYLCTREAVCNALRHAQADTIFLLIAVSNNELKVGIRDNGCGFSMDPSSVVGNGLANMRYRMGSVGGRFHLESHPGCGCLVEFLVSLKTKKS